MEDNVTKSNQVMEDQGKDRERRGSVPGSLSYRVSTIRYYLKVKLKKIL